MPARFESSDSGGPCNQDRHHPATVHVRDSKVADGPQFAVGPGAWAGFVAYATGG
ncbi:DUF397 domain-containing protein [Streptomyces sp. NPDC055607]